MSPYTPPDYDETSEMSMGVPAKGWHDVSITATLTEPSKSGNEMITFIFTIDSGTSLGYEMRDYAPLGLEGGFGEKKCKSIAVNANWRWPAGLKGVKKFAAAFVTDPPLRLSVLVEHSLSIEEGGSWRNDVSQEDWDTTEEKKNKKGQIARYGKANDVAEWQPSSNDDGLDPNADVPF